MSDKKQSEETVDITAPEAGSTPTVEKTTTESGQQHSAKKSAKKGTGTKEVTQNSSKWSRLLVIVTISVVFFAAVA